jgi:hypothetical protein
MSPFLTPALPPDIIDLGYVAHLGPSPNLKVDYVTGEDVDDGDY